MGQCKENETVRLPQKKEENHVDGSTRDQEELFQQKQCGLSERLVSKEPKPMRLRAALAELYQNEHFAVLSPVKG
jgi:hypothetical protein